MTTTILVGFVALLGVASFAACARHRVEQPAYTVVRTDGDFEIREYPALKTIAAPMAEGKGDDGTFMRLFRYIDGGNEAGAKISMTSPVLMDRAGGGKMAFVLPKKVADGDVPAPLDKNLTVAEVAGGKFAVLRFRGVRGPEAEARALAALKEKIAAAQLGTEGEPRYAYYDPPWTPSPLRRNEVIWRLAAAGEERKPGR